VSAVPEYRVFYVGKVSGHFVDRKEFACPSDEAALERAKQLADGLAIELWEGDRLIARIEGTDKSDALRHPAQAKPASPT
jgi:hypothetical protein